MSDISVRKIRFDFPDSFDLGGTDEAVASALPSLALSMTMPYLEPYLIRTMKVAIKQISDPELAEDARRFSQQEGHHYRNHAVFNRTVREHFGGTAAEELRAIEAALDADYQRFTRQKSLRFNVAYAEGFEAMTCAGALAMAEHGMFDGSGATMPGGEMWAWHMAEEIEHRTVAFCVFDHLFGSYPVRIVLGTWAQWHYIRYIGRFATCMANALGRKLPRTSSPMQRASLRNYLRTWSPFYHPSKIVVPDSVNGLLARYSALATSEVSESSEVLRPVEA
jgi:predicted metal-dependent hydrolase